MGGHSMLFKTRLILASAAVSVLCVFAFVSRNLRAEHAGSPERQVIDLDNTEGSAAVPSNGEPSFSAQQSAEVVSLQLSVLSREHPELTTEN